MISYNTKKILEFLDSLPRDKAGNAWVTGPVIQEATGLSPVEIKDAVDILEKRELVQRKSALGTAPFNFEEVQITAEGRLSLE